jgi:hypothetical protein
MTSERARFLVILSCVPSLRASPGRRRLFTLARGRSSPSAGVLWLPREPSCFRFTGGGAAAAATAPAVMAAVRAGGWARVEEELLLLLLETSRKTCTLLCGGRTEATTYDFNVSCHRDEDIRMVGGI